MIRQALPGAALRFWLSLGTLSLLLATASPARGHGPVHQQIRKVSARIAESPNDARLYVDRGRMFLTQAHVRRARADFRRALLLDPSLVAARYFLAQTELAAGRDKVAERYARQFLEASADDNTGALVRGHRLLAKILNKRRQLREAAEHQQAAISIASTPLPDDYLLLAEVLQRQKRFDDAASALDAGVAALGPLAALEQRALEIELEAGALERALARLDRLIRSEGWPLPWMVRRAETLATHGDSVSARAAIDETLGFIERLPARRRRASAVKSLEKRVRALLARVGQSSNQMSRRPGR